MDLARISEIVAAVCSSRTITELTIREGSTRLTIRRRVALPVPQEAATTPPPAQPPEPHVVRSPLVGTFRALSTDGQPTVTVGSVVEAGQVLGAIESMRMLYDVATEVGGVITAVLVEEGQPVEYGQDLFHIQPQQAVEEDERDGDGSSEAG